MMDTEATLRKIIHIDMDAFYASIEQRDHPAYRGKPVIVGGAPNTRGVVATCSYEARRYGIHSAMPAQTAYRLCPHAIFVKPRMDVYRQVSREVAAILHSYTDLVEPLSLDEAYLDVTHNRRGIASATRIARAIREEIWRKTALTASAGVSYNKFIAKSASDHRKPNGLTVITPEQAQAFLDAVPVRKFFGVGKVTEQRLHELGVHTGEELRRLSVEELSSVFFDRGRAFYHLVRGIDPRPVEPERVRLSIGKETTFPVDIDDVAQMIRILEDLARNVEISLKHRALRARVVVLKVKFADFRQITRRMTTTVPVQTADELGVYLRRLLEQVDLRTKVRLLGVTAQHLQDEAVGSIQLTLF